MEEYTLKCDMNVPDAMVGYIPLLKIISLTVEQALHDANIPYKPDVIDQFVNENCFITFVHSNIPFRFKIV